MARYLMLVKKDEVPENIECWRAQLTSRLAPTGWTVRVDDTTSSFQRDAVRCGGFPGWIRHVVHGCGMDGQPNFHGTVVPMDDPDALIGRGTFDLLVAFGKAQPPRYRYVWWEPRQALLSVVGVEQTAGDFKAYGRIRC